MAEARCDACTWDGTGPCIIQCHGVPPEDLERASRYARERGWVQAQMPDPSTDRSTLGYQRFRELEDAYDAAHGRLRELEAERDRLRDENELLRRAFLAMADDCWPDGASTMRRYIKDADA